MAAGARGVQYFSRRACRVFGLKTNGNLLKSSLPVIHGLPASRPNGACDVLSILNHSSKTRQFLNSVAKNNKWNKSVFDSINQSSSSAMVNLLSSGCSPLTVGVCCSSDELSSDGDEDSTNRKKRIYILEHANDDP